MANTILDHVVVVNSGDAIEVTSGYDGYVYSDRMNSESLPKRFKTTHRKLVDVLIRNSGASNFLIGQYYASPSSFVANAFTMVPNYPMGFDYIDIYYLGYMYSTPNYTSIEIVGTY